MYSSFYTTKPEPFHLSTNRINNHDTNTSTTINHTSTPYKAEVGILTSYYTSNTPNKMSINTPNKTSINTPNKSCIKNKSILKTTPSNKTLTPSKKSSIKLLTTTPSKSTIKSKYTPVNSKKKSPTNENESKVNLSSMNTPLKVLINKNSESIIKNSNIKYINTPLRVNTNIKTPKSILKTKDVSTIKKVHHDTPRYMPKSNKLIRNDEEEIDEDITFSTNKTKNINLDDSLTDNDDLEVTFKQKKKLIMEDVEDDDDFEITFKKPFELLSISDLNTPSIEIIEQLNFDDDAAVSNQKSIYEITKEIENAADTWSKTISELCTQSQEYIEELFYSDCTGFERKGFINFFGKTLEFDYVLIAEGQEQKYFKIVMKQTMKHGCATFILNLLDSTTNFWPLTNADSTPKLIEKTIITPKVETIKQTKTYIDYSTDIELDNDWDYLKNKDFTSNRDREVGGLSRYFNNLCE